MSIKIYQINMKVSKSTNYFIFNISKHKKKLNIIELCLILFNNNQWVNYLKFYANYYLRKIVKKASFHFYYLT